MATRTDPTSDLDDLRSVSETDGPFFSAILPTRSDVADAGHRLDVRWGNARRQLSARWTDDLLADVDTLVESLGHDGGASLAIVHSAAGHTLAEFLPASPLTAQVREGVLPALVPVIEGRQRAVPHVVVETDKAGADIVAYNRSSVLTTERVDGEELHIHRGHPGGWSQRRFQQRAENTWNDNADDVADAVATLADQTGARMIAVAGPPRAKSMVVNALRERNAVNVVEIDAGDADGIAAEIVTMLDDTRASALADVSRRLRDGLAHETAVGGVDATIDALIAGRVATLLVTDDWTDTTELTKQLMDIAPGARAIDAAVAAALRTEADIVVVPSLAAMNGPLAAILRW